MAKKPILSKVKDETNISPNILDERVKSGETNVESLRSKVKKQSDYIKTISIWVLPFKYRGYTNEPIFSKEIHFDWNSYKELLFNEWKDLTKNRRVMTPAVSDVMYYAGLVFGIIFTIVCIVKGWYSVFGLNWFGFAAAVFIAYEIFTGFISTLYFLIRPNLVNKRQAKAELKKISRELKIAENELQINKNLLEQYTIAQINPMQKFNEVKTRNIDELHEILAKAREEIIPNISTGYAEAFGNALDKAEKLLEMGREDGRIITEINKIYVIYITDISNVLLKTEVNTLGDRVEVIEMLNNFSAFLDRKIEKFSKVNQMLVDSDINALNKAFTEEV